MAQDVSKTTTDHDTIRRWVEERGGWPAEVEATGGEGQTGLLRIDFPGRSGEGTLRRVEWVEWFRKFDETGLAFVFEEETAGGERSSFNALVAREMAEAEAPERGARTSRRSASGGARARGRAGKTAPRGGEPRKTASRGGGRKTAARGTSQRKTSGAVRRKPRTGGRRVAARGAAARTTRSASRGSGRRATKRRGGGRATRRSR